MNKDDKHGNELVAVASDRDNSDVHSLFVPAKPRPGLGQFDEQAPDVGVLAPKFTSPFFRD